MPVPTSQAQARLFGAVAGGGARKAVGMKPSEARTRLRGVKVGRLPKQAKADNPGRKGFQSLRRVKRTGQNGRTLGRLSRAYGGGSKGRAAALRTGRAWDIKKAEPGGK